MAPSGNVCIMGTVADKDTRLVTAVNGLDRILEGGEHRGLHVFVGGAAHATTWVELMATIESRRPPDIMPEPGS